MERFELVRAEDLQTLAACLRVRETVFTVEKGVPRSIEADAHDGGFADGICDHFLLRYGGREAGALRCLRLPDGVVQLQRFCVLADCRGMGAGRAALAALEEHYRAQGAQKLTLDAKFEVRAFYARCGYDTVSDVFEEAGIPHVKMEKLL